MVEVAKTSRLVSIADFTGYKPELVKFELPELGEGLFIYVKPMSGYHLDKILEVAEKTGHMSAIESVKYCVCDENGKAFFHSNDEVNAFAEAIPGHILKKLAEVCMKTSRFGETNEEEIKN